MAGPDPRPALDRWGIQGAYQDTHGAWRQAPDTTLDAVLVAMGATTEAPAEPANPVVFVRGGHELEALGPGTLEYEHGGGTETGMAGAGSANGKGGGPENLPLGYHHWTSADGDSATTVVVSPRACLLPRIAPAWGWAVQLYAMRSRASWGIGDLADLRGLGRWSRRELGAGLLLVNPLHASGPTLPQSASPYFPSSRRFRSPLYLRVEEVPGAERAGLALEPLAAAGRALNSHRLIDRDQVLRLKMEALAAIWETGLDTDGAAVALSDDPEFRHYRDEQGTALSAWAAYCVLAERLGNNWRVWPAAYRRPDGREVAQVRAGAEARFLFHEWLQWQLDRQLAGASAELGVVHDLAVGFDPDGADAWLWQDSLAPGMSVGAPADEINTTGQDWGLPPFDPWRLRSSGYLPFIETMRAGFRHAGGLRVDHVMGLFRLFWVPHGASPAEGAYVRYPAEDLLDIIALESHRSGAFVVGEDLGTVEDHVRSELTTRRILSYRLLWFEERPPPEWPAQAMGSVTTHDLPTVAGVWTGSDLVAQRQAGMHPNEEAAGALRERIKALATPDDSASAEAVVLAAHAELGRAASMLVTAALDDALAVEERPNMPGTTDQWPNWSLALPLPLEEIREHPLVLAVAETLRRRRRT